VALEQGWAFILSTLSDGNCLICEIVYLQKQPLHLLKECPAFKDSDLIRKNIQNSCWSCSGTHSASTCPVKEIFRSHGSLAFPHCMFCKMPSNIMALTSGCGSDYQETNRWTCKFSKKETFVPFLFFFKDLLSQRLTAQKPFPVVFQGGPGDFPKTKDADFIQWIFARHPSHPTHTGGTYFASWIASNSGDFAK
jgi:hypothetical protein